jgi:hypothetical protein
MIRIVNGKECHVTDEQWLLIISSYLRHQIDPQPSIPLDYLESLDVTDLDAITPDMFEMKEYTREEIEDMLEALRLIIIDMENKEQ